MADKDKLTEWIEMGLSKGVPEKELKKKLLDAGYSSVRVDFAFQNQHKENKASKKTWIYVLLVFIFAAILLFLLLSAPRGRENEFYKPQAYIAIDSSDKWAYPTKITDPENIVKISDDEYVNSLLTQTMDEIWESRKCTFPKDGSLINLIHIKKTANGFEYNCSLGKLHSFQLYKRIGKSKIFQGSIETCELDVIQSIDESLNGIGDCRIKLDYRERLEGIALEDYYLFSIGCKSLLLDPKKIRVLKTIPCFEDLSEEQARLLDGQEFITDGFYGIIIPSLDMVIY